MKIIIDINETAANCTARITIDGKFLDGTTCSSLLPTIEETTIMLMEWAAERAADDARLDAEALEQDQITGELR